MSAPRRQPESRPGTRPSADRSSSSDGDEFRRQVHGSLTGEELLARLDAADVEIDARGTFCPEPVIRTQDRMRDMPPGQVALLLADDAGVEVDIPAWCMSTGNEFLGLVHTPDLIQVLVRKR